MNVYRIAREHGGRAEIESEQGRGTCVRVRLPLTQRPVRLLTEEPPAAMGDSGSEVGESLENNTAD
jgi:hypothetical protein